jgi:hypothetical protein
MFGRVFLPYEHGVSSSVVKEQSPNSVDDQAARLEFSILCRIHCAVVNVKVAGPGHASAIGKTLTNYIEYL